MGDLDEPVLVTVIEVEVYNGRVERSMEFLLDWFEEWTGIRGGFSGKRWISGSAGEADQ